MVAIGPESINPAAAENITALPRFDIRLGIMSSVAHLILLETVPPTANIKPTEPPTEPPIM